jgi:hypothetical protein
MKDLKILFCSFVILMLASFANLNCAGSKSNSASNTKVSIDPVSSPLSLAKQVQNQTISDLRANNRKISNPGIIKKTDKNDLTDLDPVKIENQKKSYSNYIRVKTVYELAMEANPSMFFPHDEFETVSEYKERVSNSSCGKNIDGFASIANS